MEVYLAIKRVQYEGDAIIGVFSTEQNAEQSIIKHIRSILKELLFDENEDNLGDILDIMGAKWDVDRHAVDGCLVDTYGMTFDLIKELLAK